jgi:hypothetical protein
MLNDMEGVEKRQYSLSSDTLSEAESHSIFRHGVGEGAKTLRIQADFGDGRYDSTPKCDVDGFDDPDCTMACDEMRQAWLAIKSSRSEEHSGDAK